MDWKAADSAPLICVVLLFVLGATGLSGMYGAIRLLAIAVKWIAS